MCGIVALVSFNEEVDKNILINMTRSLAHRGPDGEGIFLQNPVVGLGHRRLAILNTDESAAQPFLSSSQNSVIVFNGEIYNHQELRKELESEGIGFRTDHSDTEVIIEGFENWGIDKLLLKLNGMFSFIIYDISNSKLFIARDRVGIKPLYIYRSDNKIAFSSEIRAFYELPFFKAKLNKAHLKEHFYFRSLSPPKTLFKDITKICPGQVLELDLVSRKEVNSMYWEGLGQEKNDLMQESSSIREQVEKSVKLQLLADVPVGLFLSGGLDSSLLLALSSRDHKGIKTFTASFPENSEYDEYNKAMVMSEHFGSTSIKVNIYEKQFLEDLKKMCFYLEEPISAPVCVPVMKLSEEAQKNKVPVILAGEGADEIFIGYTSWVRINLLVKILNKLPQKATKFLARILIKLITILNFDKSGRIIDILSRIQKKQPLFWGGAWDFSSKQLNKILIDSNNSIESDQIYKSAIEPIYKRYCQNYDPKDNIAWMSFLDFNFRLPELMLMRLDKLAMASSIEGRVPYLDHLIVENWISKSKQEREKITKQGKDSLRKLSHELLPGRLSKEKKIGFRAPVKEWKTGFLGDYSKNIIITFTKRTNIFQINGINELLELKNDRLYYSILNFCLWYNQFIDEVLPEFNLKYD